MSNRAKRPSRLRAVLGITACLLGMAASFSVEAATIHKTAAEPAATLLLPYFEQDLRHPQGATTVLSVNNASPRAVLAHLTIWSDLSVPVFDFNMYLTGYDAQTINLRDLLVNGLIPQTASAGQDPADTISPHGPLSQDINFADCSLQLPPPAVLPAVFIQHLQTSLTGRPSPVLGGFCAGRTLGDNIARGYITVDVVKHCTLRFPSDPGYFGPGGDAADDNVLWGDYAYLNRDHHGQAEGNPLVHIVADPAAPETTTAGNYTFYGRYVGWSAVDHRYPLATNFATRYVNDGDSTTNLVVWRDSKLATNAFTCPAAFNRPSWYPLGEESVFAFDDTEQVVELPKFPASPVPSPGLALFPAEAQRIAVGGSGLSVPFASGWLDLNLNSTVVGAANLPPADPLAEQAWVAVQMGDSNGLFSVGYDAIQLDSASHANHTNPNP